jgi:pimeloyl-ACP methyl ester carboxylesterase
MTRTTEAELTQVTAPDGTSIAVFVSGEGRPLVLVSGTSSDHTTWRLVGPLLARHARVHAVDRRGRGGSGDRAGYSIDQEYADVAAVIDAAAEAARSTVDLFGHSYGGNVAFGAAALTANVGRLILYEGWPVPNVAHRTVPPALLEHLDDLLAQGRNADLLDTFFRRVVMTTDDEVDQIRAAPTWPARMAAAHTVPRELRAFAGCGFHPAQVARIGVPVLLLVGECSPDEIRADPDIVAAALPDARIGVLEGQAHVAHLTAPELLAQHILDFLVSRPTSQEQE